LLFEDSTIKQQTNMKKFLFASLLMIAVYSCTKKATPVKSGTATQTTETETKVVASAEVIAAGKIVYEAKCGKCHALHATDEFTAAKWVPLVDAMAPKARLTEVEKTNVLAYVQSAAKP
jgi:cytochrome c5